MISLGASVFYKIFCSDTFLNQIWCPQDQIFQKEREKIEKAQNQNIDL